MGPSAVAEKVVSFHKFPVVFNSLGPSGQIFKPNDHKVGPGKNLAKKRLNKLSCI